MKDGDGYWKGSTVVKSEDYNNFYYTKNLMGLSTPSTIEGKDSIKIRRLNLGCKY